MGVWGMGVVGCGECRGVGSVGEVGVWRVGDGVVVWSCGRTAIDSCILSLWTESQP